MKANESPYKEVKVVPTGLLALDGILGVGGIPLRKLTELSGQWSVGKSTLALQIIAQAQKEKRDCLYADSEFAFDENYATSLGVDCAELDLLQERIAEDALNFIEIWALEHTGAILVLDAVGALLTREEAEKGAEGRVIGGQARLIAAFCRKIIPILAVQNNALIVLNHQFVNLMSGRLQTSGGAKLEHARSIWLSMRKLKPVTGGIVVEVEVRKNKVAPTTKQKAELTMIYGKGFLTEPLPIKRRGRPKKEI